MQADEPDLEKVSVLQGLHTDAPDGAKVPAAHWLHEEAAARAYEPLAQGRHVEGDDGGPYVPPEQGLQKKEEGRDQCQ